MKDKTPFQEFIDHQKEIGNGVRKLAKLWGVMHQTVYNAYNSGYIKEVKLLKAICEKSGGNPRVLMGLPPIATCIHCHREMHVSRLVFREEADSKRDCQLDKNERMANDYDNAAAYYGGYDGE